MASSQERFKRDFHCAYNQYDSGGRCYDYSPWHWWGRWVFAAVAISIPIAILVLLGCISARRRRRRGLRPYYGTGWMASRKKYGPNNEMYPQNEYQPTPPPYQAQQLRYTGRPFNATDGSYGTQNQGITYPANTYQRDQVSSPPAEPQPGK